MNLPIKKKSFAQVRVFPGHALWSKVIYFIKWVKTSWIHDLSIINVSNKLSK